MNAIVDWLPRPEYEIYNRDAYKDNFSIPAKTVLDKWGLDEKSSRDVPSNMQIIVGARIWELDMAPLKKLKIPEVLYHMMAYFDIFPHYR